MNNQPKADSKTYDDLIAHVNRGLSRFPSTRLIGRWNAGPLGFNLSKRDVSASMKNQAGIFNFLKPQYFLFKLGGVQLRGIKAAQMQLIYIAIMSVIILIIFVFKPAILLL